MDAQSANKNDAYLWTGSWNVSSESQDEANNSIWFHDYGLAAAYTLDFNQMWGSSTPTANLLTSKMGSRKAEVMPHQFLVGGVRVEAYQSPSDQPENHMIEYIQQSQRSQQFCIFDFTSDPLSHAMKVHRDSIPGFIVRGTFEGSQVSSPSEWYRLNGDAGYTDTWVPRGDVTENNSPYFTLLHHKYQIFDESDPAHAIVWTGSHNWSAAAKTNNDENTVVVHEANIANLYFQEFAARFLESGGAIPKSVAAVLSPNGGEAIAIGTPITLTWSMTGNTGSVSTVDLYISRDYGVHYTPIALGVPNTGSYDWTVDGPDPSPGNPIFSSLFRVVGIDQAGNPGSDVSDTPFSIFDAAVGVVVTKLEAEPAEFGMRIRWALPNAVQFSAIDLQRSDAEAGPWTILNAARQVDAGMTVAEDRTVAAGQSYWYLLVASTSGGAQAVFGPVKGEAAAPREFALRAAWPNPSPGSIQTEFAVSRTAPVRLSVLDLQGREVQVLAKGQFAPGRYSVTWDGRTGRGPTPAGIYFLRYQTPAKNIVQRLVIAP